MQLVQTLDSLVGTGAGHGRGLRAASWSVLIGN